MESSVKNLPEVFRHCPSCGDALKKEVGNPLQCPCGFVFYFNPAIAVVGFISDSKGRLLVIRRERDPGRGMLGFPGGFVDAGEGAEEALTREIREETGLSVDSLDYLTSFPNEYVYRGIRYQITDLFYTGVVPDLSKMKRDPGEVQELLLLKPEEIDPGHLVFPSNREALGLYVKRKSPL